MRVEPLETLVDMKFALDHCIALAKLMNKPVIISPVAGAYVTKDAGERARVRAAGEFYRYSTSKGLPKSYRNKLIPLLMLSDYVKKSGFAIVVEPGGTVRFNGEAVEVKELIDNLVKPWEYFNGS